MDLYLKIYEVIKNNDVIFSKNSNGVFFDLNTLDDTKMELIIYVINKYEGDSDSKTNLLIN